MRPSVPRTRVFILAFPRRNHCGRFVRPLPLTTEVCYVIEYATIA